MIDLKNSIAIIFAWEHAPAIPSTVTWIRENVPSVYMHYKEPYITSRNTAIRDIAIPQLGKAEWAIFVDNDVTITHPGIEKWLEVEGDIVACEWGTSQSWAKDKTAFHQTLWRAKIDVLEKIPAPWFQWVYSEDGCEVLYPCDCEYFRLKALESGAIIRHGGRCSHKRSRSALKSS